MTKTAVSMQRFTLPALQYLRRRLAPTMDQTARSLHTEALLEEEQNPDYDPKRFYPARAGEVIRNYQLLSKLGWGTGSTVWLAKGTSWFGGWPWQKPMRYAALKITNCFEVDRKSAADEVKMSQLVSQISSEHPGRAYVRLIEDSFEITGPFGQHIVLVYEPLREPFWMVGRRLGLRGLPPKVLKPFLRLILQSLDFLHTECHIIHTDLKGDNFLIPFEDKSVIEDYVRRLKDNPPISKEVNGHPTYQSQPDFGSLKRGVGYLKISDFGAAVLGNTSDLHYDDIQPVQFCAPEVLLKAGWTYSADIWNLGMVLWELLSETSLLDGLEPNSGQYSQAQHLAQTIRLLGPPPQSLLARADKNVYSEYFTTEGSFRYENLIPSTDFTFSNRTPFLDGDEKQAFLEFASKMLQWLPEKRATAKELYNDPWLAL